MENLMNIVLIGYRGTGKTTIATILGERLKMRVVGMDDEIVRRAGQSIPEIVEQHGWDHFRDIESAVAADFGNADGLIIDAGGGIIVRRKNVDNLRKNGIIFWLVADKQTIVSRIKDDTQRPSLTGSKSFVEEVSEILAERNPKYRAAADHIIDTVHNTDVQATETIAELFLEARSSKE
jgi:shikimate kinase